MIQTSISPDGQRQQPATIGRVYRYR